MLKANILITFVMLFGMIYSLPASAKFPLNKETQLSKEEAIAIFSDRIRTCVPDRREFIMKFYADGKLEARNNNSSDNGKWSVENDGRVSVIYNGSWKNWNRVFYKNPGNQNEIGYRGTRSGTFYTCTMTLMK
jgi:hypothetical protein